MQHSAPTPPQRPALRLVSTKGMQRDDWLAVRKRGIGASDAAVAIGLSPYQSQLELWLVKTGRDTRLPQPDLEDDCSPLYWGNVLEPIVAEHYSKRTGHKVRRINAVLQHSDPDKPWMLANLDYTVVGADDVQILECKTAGEFGSRLWRDGVPEYVQCQVQHQLAVTGKTAADVCVLICGQEIRIHRIERDEALIERLIELERHFWHYVETDTPPSADGSESAGRALQCLYPQDSGATIDLSDEAEMVNAYQELIHTREELEALSDMEALLKQRIQARMGKATRALFPEGDVSWKRSKDSQTLNVQAALKDQPDLLQRYPQTRQGSRRFLLRPGRT